MEQNKKNYIETVLEIFNKFSFQQKIMLGGVIILTLVILVFALFIFNEPNYSVLFTNLSQEDAGKAIEYLQSEKIPYKVDEADQTIRVPKEKVYEARLALAGKGVPSSGVIGYEIFDKNTMGMSDFMQKLNFKRALEGELSRTIMQQAGVEAARVHIVFPAKSVFKDEQKEPTSSVVLKLSNGAGLSQQNIQAIANLVAGSVEGLRPEKVTIVDTKGNLLTRNQDDGSFGVTTGKQYELKSAVENYLVNKAQTILDNVLGYGNSVIRINADIDFNQIEKTMELYDPETQVAISEQTIKSESGGKSMSDSNVVLTENTTTNYEVSKTVQRVIEGAGNIKRLTLAAVINGVTKEIKQGDEVKKVIEPRTDEQMKKLEEIIKQAVGFNAERNDEVSVVTMPFETQEMNDLTETDNALFMPINDLSNVILSLTAIAAVMLLLRSLLKRLKNEKIVIGTFNYKDAEIPDLLAATGVAGNGSSNLKLESGNHSTVKRPMIEVGDIADEYSTEALQKKAQQDKIINYVSKNPMEAAKLINLWLREDDYE